MVRLGKVRRRGEEQTDLVAGFGFLNKHQARRDTLLQVQHDDNRCTEDRKAGWCRDRLVGRYSMCRRARQPYR